MLICPVAEFNKDGRSATLYRLNTKRWAVGFVEPEAGESQFWFNSKKAALAFVRERLKES